MDGEAMKKYLKYVAVILITAFFMMNINKNKKLDELSNESRGVFISYVEYIDYFQGKKPEEIKRKIDDIIDEIKNNYLNCIYLQVRPFSDSIYESSIFPSTHTISGIQGKNIGFDVLDYFIEK